jgi:hypothetical protein
MNSVIQNERLKVSFRLPAGPPHSSRFDASGCVEQVLLDDRHSFCEPEQILPGRHTTNGVGLCGEFRWDELAAEAAPGEQFPKFGVGLLTQITSGGSYDIRKHDAYAVAPFRTDIEIDGQRACFVQRPETCMGVAARVMREYRLEGNSLLQYTAITNTGERVLDLYEYQHNFVSIDGISIGTGYQLELPLDDSAYLMERAVWKTNHMPEPEGSVIQTDGKSVHWLCSMEDRVLFRESGCDEIKAENGLCWNLSHTGSPASIAEWLSFSPDRIVYWGVEHCICVEAYIKILLNPGMEQSWSRRWVFDD